ncbi:MAG: hypothetical protein ACRDYA_00290 [Egibacteraceae bacterium]
MGRRELLIGGVAAATQLAFGRDLRADYLNLAHAYPTTSPGVLLRGASRLLNRFTRALRGSMLPSARRQAQVDAAGTASLASLAATFTGQHAEAAA